MARIIAPNKQYAGVSAGVPFTGGEGHTDNEYLIKWFHDHGYEVIEEPEAEPETDPGKQSGTVTENAADESSADKPAEETAVAPAQKKGRKKEG
ncbi:MAG: hypothetical protein IJV14_15510 [Lachnospiraceae bacterium]|nr:hypothetical protein [Lachnospiraceae bacterium]